MKLNSLILVDAVGTLAVGACITVAVWCGLLDAAGAADQISDLTGEVARLEDALGSMKSLLERQQDEYQQRQAAFGARDLLPESTSVEGELRTVNDLAQKNRLELTGFTPLGSKRYPGVDELRYRMTAQGSFADHLGFLRDFETGASWADITFLELSAVNAQAPNGRTAEFTISLYSAVKENAVETATP